MKNIHCDDWSNIQRFAEGGAGASGAAAGAGDGAAATGAGETPQDAAGEGTDATAVQQPDKATLFRNMIDGEYRAEFQQVMQPIIDKRFAKAKATEASNKAMMPIISMLADKYGVKADDLEGLSKAIEADESFYEEDAAKAGMSVAQYKDMKRLQRENSQLRAAQEDAANRQQQEEALAKLNAEIEDAKKIYPHLDLATELNDPNTGANFGKLLRSGIPVQTCYEVVHKDEIMMGAMQYTAQQTASKMAANMQARRNRPPENGTAGSGAATGTYDVNKMTKAERRALADRARAGERIVL